MLVVTGNKKQTNDGLSNITNYKVLSWILKEWLKHLKDISSNQAIGNEVNNIHVQLSDCTSLGKIKRTLSLPHRKCMINKL